MAWIFSLCGKVPGGKTLSSTSGLPVRTKPLAEDAGAWVMPQPDEEPPQRLHDKSFALASKNRPMIAALCSQSCVSTCNCLRPSRLSR